MRHSELEGRFRDDRGLIQDVLVTDKSSTTYITFTKGAKRANHFHKKTTQWDLVVSGSLVCASGNKKVELSAGDMIEHKPGVAHAYEALEDSEMVSICYGERVGRNYEEDTYRLEKGHELL